MTRPARRAPTLEAELAALERLGRERALTAAESARLEQLLRRARDREREAGAPPPAVRRLLDRAAARCGCTRAQLLGRSRRAPLARARFAVAWVAHARLGLSLHAIGAALGGRDHTTILNAWRRAERLRDGDPDFRALTDALATPRKGA